MKKSKSNSSYFSTLGASNHSTTTRHPDDYYCTDPIAVDYLVNSFTELPQTILEPCCGEGHLSKRLQQFGYNVISEDLYDRGFGKTGIDFLKRKSLPSGVTAIVTNFPFKEVLSFTLHALDLLPEDGYLVSFARSNFLEGKERYDRLFKNQPPQFIYQFSGRIKCGNGGVFPQSSAVAYSWFVWKKGFQGEPTLRWLR